MNDTWEVIAHSEIPGDNGVIYLCQCGTEYTISVNGAQLMGNLQYGSEAALATLACDRLSQQDGVSVLVGGLGMGFTLAAVLQRTGHDSVVTVAELLPAVVAWNRGELGAASKHPLRDPRVRVREQDVGRVIAEAPGRWHAILLDVDNGPDAFTHPRNAWLYDLEGLGAAYRALVPGGVLAIWSAFDDPSFTARLGKIGFRVERLCYTAEGEPTTATTDTHVLWMATRD